MTAWQPMETAPKDREILITTGEWTFVAKWHVPQHLNAPPYWRSNACIDDYCGVDADGEATHWQPVPEPPK